MSQPKVIRELEYLKMDFKTYKSNKDENGIFTTVEPTTVILKKKTYR